MTDTHTQANTLFAACGAIGNSAITENGDLTRASSLDACVDFFYKIHDTSSSESVRKYLSSAWQQSPEDALRLLFFLLDIRNGKSSTLPALYGLQWLFERHPETLLINLGCVREFGCIRDFATLLFISRCDEVNGVSFEIWNARKRRNRRHEHKVKSLYKTLRRTKLSGPASRLHTAIVQLFISALTEDKGLMTQGKAVSLYSKWLPSQDSHLNRATGLFDDVALSIYEKDRVHSTHDTQSSLHHSPRRPLIRARNHLRNDYISPMREHAAVTERLMSDRKWSEIQYSGVPSQCMDRNSPRFTKHDKERFSRFLMDAAKGEVDIKAAVLRPHEICFPKGKRARLSDELSTAQWESYTSKLKAIGTLQKAVAVCDVSGSMTGEPMAVAVSLGLLVATLAEPPWQGHLITFSENPFFHLVQGRSLREKVANIQSMYWSMNTNFDRVFDKILDRAQTHGVKAADMPSTIFVFSDMQFDHADPTMTTTAFERIEVKYSAAGYLMPRLVFWNLRDSHGVPVTTTEEGTALVSGFSGNLLKLFLDGGDFAQLGEDEIQSLKQPAMTPAQIMRKAIDHERFGALRVVD